ncbi:MAG TPA: hypothetical protein VIS10_02980 [Anaerolineales bacterium]
MQKYQGMINLVLKAVALAMAVASLVMGILGTSTVEAIQTLLSIGLFSLALAALQRTE